MRSAKRMTALLLAVLLILTSLSVGVAAETGEDPAGSAAAQSAQNERSGNEAGEDNGDGAGSGARAGEDYGDGNGSGSEVGEDTGNGSGSGDDAGEGSGAGAGGGNDGGTGSGAEAGDGSGMEAGGETGSGSDAGSGDGSGEGNGDGSGDAGNGSTSPDGAGPEDGTANPAAGDEIERSADEDNEGIAVSGLSIDGSAARNLGIGQSLRLIPTIEPRDAGNKTLDWASSNPAAATVENGLVRGVGIGIAVITATTGDGGYRAAVTVNVKTAGQSIAYPYLSDLRVDGETVAHFQPGTFAYEVDVEAGHEPEVEAEPMDEDAEVEIELPASYPGEVRIVVTAAGGGSRSYTLDVTVDGEGPEPGDDRDPDAPAERYYIQNSNWRLAESIPPYHSVDAVLYLDEPSDRVQVQESALIENGGVLSQFAPSGSSRRYEADAVVEPGDGDMSELDAEILSYTSAQTYFFYQNELVGVPTAALRVDAAGEGEVTVLMEVVDTEGVSTLIAKGTAALAGGEERVEVTLKRAYDDGQGDQPEFVAFALPRYSTLRVGVYSDEGNPMTLYHGDSSVTLPFLDSEENVYNGKIIQGDDRYRASLYWFEENIYVNYTVEEQNDTWLSLPADSAYTVDEDGLAVFEEFTFKPESNAVKNGAEQSYNGTGEMSQPFPSVRHVLVDTVPIEPVADVLYLPTTKALKFDIFQPTGGSGGGGDLPLIFYIHGYNGSYTALPAFLVDMLAEGYAVAGIDLRNYPSNFSPDYYHDIKGNIRYIRANAAEYGVDPERFGIYGVSLGGNTALMMLVSGGNEHLEGTVGGNLGVSSRLQAGIAGYAWTDALNFGADQRTDNAHDPVLLASMITGGDGEYAPVTKAIDFYGPGKGLLALRLYAQAREQVEADGTLDDFLSEPYSFTVDEDYLERWFPVVDGSGSIFNIEETATPGTYTYEHEYLMEKLAWAKAASPLYYIAPDAPEMLVFGGYGGSANITNTQSTRTLKKLDEMGVDAIMLSNTLGNYGAHPEQQATMKAYLDEALGGGNGGVKLALRSDRPGTAVVNNVDRPADVVMMQIGDELYIGVALLEDIFDVELDAETLVGSTAYVSASSLRGTLGASVGVYEGESFVSNHDTEPYYSAVIKVAAPSQGGGASPVVEPEYVSLYGEYKGYADEEFPELVEFSQYVEVPASYPEVEFPSDPDYAGETIRLAITWALPSSDGVSPAGGSYPTALIGSRGGRVLTEAHEQLVRRGYAVAILEMRGCGASFGVNNSFASLENRLDVKHVIEQWITEQDWSDGSVGMFGGSNRGLIQQVSASVAPEGLKAITPVVCNADFYYQDYRNGVSSVPAGMSLSGTSLDPEVKPYDEWIENPGVKFVDEDPNGRTAYAAYAYYTERNMPFTSYLLAPNMLRDQPHEDLYGEVVNLTIPPIEYFDEIVESGVEQFQIAGWYDSNATFQIATANAWGGSVMIGPWNHGEANNGGSTAEPYDYAIVHQRWFDHVLKGVDNSFDQAPPFYYYVVGAARGAEWRYADNFPLENARDSVLYLIGEDAPVVVADELKLEGAQSNNGKLTLERPQEAQAADYRVDASIKVDGFSNLNYRVTADMKPMADEKGLTFTSAPLASAVEMVGIPSAELWISADAPDVDLVVYLEEVLVDGSSKLVTTGAIRASHRTTAENALWDATRGLAGNYHTSLTADVEAALAEGLNSPTRLSFHMEAMAYRFASGSSVRVTVTGANTSVYQHAMYYDIVNGEYELKADADMPVIRLWQGGDYASQISLPIVENVSNTFNGMVTMNDGSYTGPGSMYLFEQNWYLYANGRWTRLSVADGENGYTVRGGAAHFDAGFSFLPEGSSVVKNGIAQDYRGGGVHSLPFPSEYQLHVDRVENQNSNKNLYLPTEKTLNIDLFRPDGATGSVPVILFIHGYGGTTIDLPAHMIDMIGEGYAVAGVDLRNYPPNENPIYYHDVKGDIRYLRANAASLGLDPDRFGVYGSSLGGNTALMMLVSGDNEFMEGTVGGNTHVSSRVQAGVVGYGWSDALYFGYDQRMDNDVNPALLANMISGGDGENAPVAEAIGFSGPGMGLLVLRGYLEERQAAEDAGYLDAFLAEDYLLVIDEAYIEKHYPGMEDGENPYITGSGTATPGTYSYEHEYLMQKVRDAQAASPLYYINGDEPVFAVFGGFGGAQNITNNQSVRTLRALQEAGVLGFYYGNTNGGYGSPSAIQEGFLTYWRNYLPVDGSVGPVDPVEPPEAIALSVAALSSMRKNATLQVTAIVLPEGAPQEVVWSSSNENVLTIDEDGVVTAHKVGSAIVTAASADGTVTKMATIRVSA